MSIYRFSAQQVEGMLVDVSTDDPTVALQQMAEGGGVVKALERAKNVYRLPRPTRMAPGLTVVTPLYWSRNRAGHIVEVTEDQQSATYYMVRREERDPDISAARTFGEIIVDMQLTRRPIKIPRQQNAAPLIGPIRGDDRLRLHELIFDDAVLAGHAISRWLR